MKKETALADLAKRDNTYWKFSQSKKGNSIEPQFAEYIPGEYTFAADKDKKLSFVSNETIALCSMYGDVLTKLVFDTEDKRFEKIMHTSFKEIGGGLGEFESECLLTETNYLIMDVATIKLIFSMALDYRQVFSLLYAKNGLREKIHKSNCKKAIELIDNIKLCFDKEGLLFVEKKMWCIDEYISKMSVSI